MMRSTTNHILLAVLLIVLANCKNQTKEKIPHMDKTSDKFRAGQVWKYDTRPGEDNSTLTILNVEKYENGDAIIHVRLDGIKLYNPNSASGYSNSIGHLPFSDEAISRSVVTLAGVIDSLPDFSDGYNQWKEAWESGKAGYWKVEVKEAVEGMDRIMRERI